MLTSAFTVGNLVYGSHSTSDAVQTLSEQLQFHSPPNTTKEKVLLFLNLVLGTIQVSQNFRNSFLRLTQVCSAPSYPSYLSSLRIRKGVIMHVTSNLGWSMVGS